MERRLFHELHENGINTPSIKEFKEAIAFVNRTRNLYDPRKIDVVLDVAGGHGALAALYLIFTSAGEAVVLDPADVGNGAVTRAWGKFFRSSQRLRYRHECLRTGLPEELESALCHVSPERVLVVACHACQHLSEEVLDIACRYGVQVAVMPCCQRDVSGGSWKALSRRLQVPFAVVSDLLLAGRTMALNSLEDRYETRMKVIDASITPQNRVICLRRRASLDGMVESRSLAHTKLERAYKSAHRKMSTMSLVNSWSWWSPIASWALGLAMGYFVSDALGPGRPKEATRV